MKSALFRAVTAHLRGGLSLFGLCALGAACALVVAACGSTTSAAGTTAAGTTTASTTATSTTATSTTALAASYSAYENCITKNGGTAFAGGHRGSFAGGRPTGASGASGPVFGASGFTRPKLSAAQQKAEAACKSLLPAGGFAGGGFGGRGGFTSNPAFTKYETCLKAHGVSFTSGTRPSTSAMAAATAACASDRPAGASGFGGFGGYGGAGGAGGSGAPSASAYAKTQACLKARGVNPSGGGTSTAKLQAAIAACRSASTGATTTTGT